MNVSPIENATMVMNGNILDWLTIDRIGIIIGLILGVIALFFKLKGWRTAEDANKIANEANTSAKEANEISKNIQKKQQEYDKQVATEQIITQLNRFVLIEGKESYKIGDRHREKIAEVRNDFKEILMAINKNMIRFPQNILGELLEFTDRIEVLSKQKLIPSQAQGQNPDMEEGQIRIREERGNMLMEEAKDFIKKLDGRGH